MRTERSAGSSHRGPRLVGALLPVGRGLPAPAQGCYITQGVPGFPQDPWHPVEDHLDPLHNYRESAIGNAPALVPGPLARLQDPQLLMQ